MQTPILDNNADRIDVLPTNQTQPSHNELQIVDTLFKNHGAEVNSIVNESKEAMLIGILFILFSLPQVSDLIQKFLPISRDSFYFLLLAKALMLMLVYWLIKNFWLSRKQ